MEMESIATKKNQDKVISIQCAKNYRKQGKGPSVRSRGYMDAMSFKDRMLFMCAN